MPTIATHPPGSPGDASNIYGLTLRFLPYLLARKRRALLTGLLVLADPLTAVALIWLAKVAVDDTSRCSIRGGSG